MVAVAMLALSGGLEASAAPGPSGDTARVCSPVPGQASCNAIQLLNPGLNWAGTHAAVPGKGPGKKPPGGGGGSTTPPAGYYPTDLQSAYGLSSYVGEYASGTPPTVAVVDAYNDPNAASDLAVYRNYFGLPPCDSSTGSGCVTVEGQSGSTTSLPRSNASWSEEISLDLDMVSSICPYCHILLVEASSASYANLGAAVDTAASYPGVVAISNSYGGSETSSELSYDAYYKHSGIAVTASAGDSGYGVEYPAASPYVVAVGGTTLTGSSTTTWNQTVWSGTGSGCSAYEPAPSWQAAMSSYGATCQQRTVGDVAAVADPNTGVAVYDSFHEPGWMVFGGTSVASPIVASIFALAGNTSTFSTTNGASTAAAGFYSNSSGAYPLVPVTQGSNGSCGTYLCNAGDSLSNGYNGPTGMGTPNGISGF
ncbi:MAG: S53 family peptidase [Acidimicrobiales bacterium]